MRFRTILLLCMVALIAGLLAVTVGRVAVVLQGSAREEIAQDLRRSREVFEDVRAYRESIHRSESRVVAEEPRLKAVVATEDVSHETVIGVANELRKALQSDLFLITDGGGRLLADVLDPRAQGFDLKENPLVAGALQEGEKTGVWTSEGSVYEVQARRLSFGTTAVGVLVIGYKLDDRIVEQARRQTASQIAVELDGRLVAVSELEAGGAANRDALGATLASVPTSPDLSAAPVEITVDGARYLAIAAPLKGYAGESTIRVAVIRSLDRALAPAQNVAAVLYRIAAVALAVAVVLAVVLSRGLSRPLDGLVAFIKHVTLGKLDERAPVAGPIEVKALGEAMNRMVAELGESRRQMAAKERLEQEMEISSRIQTSILPRRVEVEGLDVAARMIPATEVGGDYYDVFYANPPEVKSGRATSKVDASPRSESSPRSEVSPRSESSPLSEAKLQPETTCWIGIGDVAGHGLTSGLIMLMVQSVVSALGRSDPNASPREIVRVLNLVLFENIRHRLGNDEHVTFSIMRYRRDGEIVYAGAHEEIVICRASTGRCELISTLGPWLGAMRDVGKVTVESTLKLEDGDLMILYTDGVTEAKDASGEQFGLERFTAAIESLRAEPVERIRDEILASVASWAPKQDDDITLLITRYHAPKEPLA